MFRFNTISATDLASLRQQCYQSLTAPLDGMWDSLIHKAVVKGIFYQDDCIGYLCHDQAFTLINFFVLDDWLNRRAEIFSQLLKEQAFPQAYVSTNHPAFLTACMEFAKRVSVYYYLFEDRQDQQFQPMLSPAFIEAEFVQAKYKDTEKVVSFCQQTTSADKAWLNSYIQEWTDKDGMYYLQLKGEILGTCEIRKSDTQPGYADLGAIVSAKYREQGLGTYLMLKGKAICYERGLKPICSCRYDNAGSRRMIGNAGFINKNLMLKVNFLI
ncbi:RimJ/RimL family protein N-acetyltransferase [Catalinimonas alkaloidigena]|uniref:GNAT family N-acetyltransferase n=1 Tax=Catalinimonas alkaloidigena TaxID=1075417 RepID=UPI002405D3ED|nr:GNAT family N-acetyltransferase [Catalinimonas alkaloidigena]MDF9799639.1 RimJ/RimL family protein N-acetyltransferase [Catalinimonas alkaloidigena]